jgi:hypothetical protein
LGYVSVDKNHHLNEKSYDEINVNVHGGLTYSGYKNNEWCFGFDCMHYGDYDPYLNFPTKGKEYVTKEITSLAKQLASYQKNN